ncbi:AsnC family transcriptional regulator [Magnetospirillum sp. UT-4]|uniref:AsnC family transcriptional regulator n=1 Tax=Magnetospirillum sp. UT-4 TaxID=2681467 RepID=UPI0013854DFA|nr:AsnC family transcriptional regulator [Magnetospirillum sp. UT-4]CAA7624262.1 Protein NirD [Magnetospirillum sp. UT-4]
MDSIDRRLLDEFQHDLPLVAEPYAAIGRTLGIGEDEVIARLKRLVEAGAVARIGAVMRPHSCGHSTLAAMAVPPERLEAVAALVSAYGEVNHNYQREHRLNLWFVVAAAGPDDVRAVLDDIARRTGIEVLDLPMLEDFHIDLGFPLRWT